IVSFELRVSRMENIELVRTAVEAITNILGVCTGLPEIERKIVAYYTVATHTIEKTNTFPLLVLQGPMGTGKSQTLRIVKAFSFRPRSLSPRGYTAAAIRDELAECQEGTAIIEEADGGWRDSQALEPMLSDRN